METGQLDASPAATVRRRHRSLLQAAGAVTGTSNRPDADRMADRTGADRAAVAPPPPRTPRAGRERSPAGRPSARSSRVAALRARLARAGRLVPPVIAPIASRGPSHATSGGS